MRMHRVPAIVTALLLALFAITGCSRSIAGTAIAEPSGAVAATAAGGAVVVGTGGQRITVFVDFLCPACRVFEAQYGDVIGAAATARKLTVEYRPVNFLDRSSASGTYSTRALQAFLAVGAESPANAVRLMRALYAHQPAESGATDLTDQQLGERAFSAGASFRVARSIDKGGSGIDGKAVGAANLKLLTAAGGTGTPTVLHDGAQVALTDSAWLQKIVG